MIKLAQSICSNTGANKRPTAWVIPQCFRCFINHCKKTWTTNQRTHQGKLQSSLLACFPKICWGNIVSTSQNELESVSKLSTAVTLTRKSRETTKIFWRPASTIVKEPVNSDHKHTKSPEIRWLKIQFCSYYNCNSSCMNLVSRYESHALNDIYDKITRQLMVLH